MSTDLAEPPTTAPRVVAAADRLIAARRTGLPTDGLAVTDIVEAFAIQARVTAATGRVAGWKCALPDGDRIVVAPIYVGTIIAAPGPVRVAPGTRVEAELAFTLRAPLPPREGGYDRAAVGAAIGDVRLALELVRGRLADPDAAEFVAMLADGLFNDGIVLGPRIPLNTVIEFVTLGGVQTSATHPAGDPLAPLIWLANHQSLGGVALDADMTIITGAFAPAARIIERATTVGFGAAGSVTTIFDFAEGNDE